MESMTIKNGFLRDVSDFGSYAIFAGDTAVCTNIRIANVHINNANGGGIGTFDGFIGLVVEDCTIFNCTNGPPP